MALEGWLMVTVPRTVNALVPLWIKVVVWLLLLAVKTKPEMVPVVESVRETLALMVSVSAGPGLLPVPVPVVAAPVQEVKLAVSVPPQVPVVVAVQALEQFALMVQPLLPPLVLENATKAPAIQETVRS